MNHNFIRISIKAFKKWKQMSATRMYLKFPQIDFQDVIYYSALKISKKN
jgi:hypothetical protein